jgi:hypothetical protein
LYITWILTNSIKKYHNNIRIPKLLKKKCCSAEPDQYYWPIFEINMPLTISKNNTNNSINTNIYICQNALWINLSVYKISTMA